MDTAAILIKTFGLALLVFTGYSVYKHVRAKLSGKIIDKSKIGEQSKIEHALNAILLYAWFTFMTALSLGMIVNN